MPNGLVKKTLSEQIYEILVDDILNGKIQPGDKLTNKELQERFQISSTPIRDAINRLSIGGFLREVSKTGAQMIDFDLQYAREINEFIAAISCDALRFSASGGNPDDVVRELHKHQCLMEKADAESYYDHDYHYHKTFFTYSMNRFLQETYENVNLIRSFLFRYAIRTQGDRSATIAQHREITEAYSSGEYDAACRLLSAHFEHGLQRANAYYQSKTREHK